MFTGFNLKKLVILTLAFVFSVGLALTVYQGGADAFDQEIQSYIFAEGREGIVAGMYQVLAHLGDWYVYTGVCLLLLIIKETRFTYGFPLSFVSVLSVIVHKLVKRAVLRPRPDAALFLIRTPIDTSFPSGHALASALFFGMLAKLIFYYAENDGASLHFYAAPHPTTHYIKRSNKIIVAIFACMLMIWLIGFARVYVGVHWPTDVIGSWLMALAILCMM